MLSTTRHVCTVHILVHTCLEACRAAFKLASCCRACSLQQCIILSNTCLCSLEMIRRHLMYVPLVCVLEYVLDAWVCQLVKFGVTCAACGHCHHVYVDVHILYVSESACILALRSFLPYWQLTPFGATPLSGCPATTPMWLLFSGVEKQHCQPWYTVAWRLRQWRQNTVQVAARVRFTFLFRPIAHHIAHVCSAYFEGCSGLFCCSALACVAAVA